VKDDGTVESGYEQTLPPAVEVASEEIGAGRKRGGVEERFAFCRWGFPEQLEKAIANLGVPAVIVEEVDDADMVLTLRSHMNKGYQRLREAKAKNVPIKTIKSNTMSQMEDFLTTLFSLTPEQMEAEVEEALREAEEAAMHTVEDQKGENSGLLLIVLGVCSTNS